MPTTPAFAESNLSHALPPRIRSSYETTMFPPDSVLSDFAQVLTHRIRNLLAGIEGFTDLLTETLGTPEQRDLALRILETTARIEGVLADLNRFSQPLHALTLPVPLHDLIERVLLTLDDALLPRLELDLPKANPNLHIDPLLLHQALLLLVQNAMEASSDDQTVSLHIHVDAVKRKVFFHVRNDGTIEIEQAAHKVFEPFFTTKANSLGIGLALARRIVVAHGGTLALSANSPQEGTRFTVGLPLSEASDPDEAHGQAS